MFVYALRHGSEIEVNEKNSSSNLQIFDIVSRTNIKIIKTYVLTFFSKGSAYFKRPNQAKIFITYAAKTSKHFRDT